MQRQCFQMELKRLENTWNKKSKLLKDEIKLVKNSKPYPTLKLAETTLKKKLGKNTQGNTNRPRLSNERLEENMDSCLSSSSATTNNCDSLTILKYINWIKFTKSNAKNYTRVVVSNATQNILKNLLIKVMGNKWKRKSNATSLPKVEFEKKMLILCCQANLP